MTKEEIVKEMKAIQNCIDVDGSSSTAAANRMEELRVLLTITPDGTYWDSKSIRIENSFRKLIMDASEINNNKNSRKRYFEFCWNYAEEIENFIETKIKL